MKKNFSKVYRIMLYTRKFYSSIYLFPIILAVIVLTLTALKINGSSMGIYNEYFYGTKNDPDLILNHPRAIRSDEWVVNTQMAIAQSNSQYSELNKNLGNSVDMSILVDAPYKGLSQLFKPHNLAFFIIPFDYAFAFKWWIMGYLLIISAYLFILALLPQKKLLAIILSLTLFFSPFIQWWYQFITLAPIYYTLFAGALFIYITKSHTRKRKIFLSIILSYVLISLALVQYPPFQIPCILVMALFVVGYSIEICRQHTTIRAFLKGYVSYIFGALLVAGVGVGLFLYQKKPIIDTIQHTAYPGLRVVSSGGYNLMHLLSSSLSFQFQRETNAAFYSIPSIGAVNQSESSNFILLIPWLLIPILLFIYRRYRQSKIIDYPLLSMIIGFFGLLVWLLVPHLAVIGKITLLDKVPHPRLLIGIGLLNFIFVILFIRFYLPIKKVSIKLATVYSCGVLAMLLGIGWFVHVHHPGFIGIKTIFVLSLFLPIVIFLVLQKKNTLAVSTLLIFSFISTAFINPLYRGTGILTHNQLSSAIQAVSPKTDKKWVMEDSFVQSFAFMNGKPSLTGVYEYPQLSIWQSLGPSDQMYIYNRYAHVNFVFDHNPEVSISSKLLATSPDHFGVQTEPCSDFIKKHNVGYIISTSTFSAQDSCTRLIKQVNFPARTFYIYALSFTS